MKRVFLLLSFILFSVFLFAQQDSTNAVDSTDNKEILQIKNITIAYTEI